ncbi:putative arginine/ornithine antiporter, partial [Staphylococcus aureus subsp. aureus TCH130]
MRPLAFMFTRTPLPWGSGITAAGDIMAATSQRLGLPALTALVVGSMVGAGIFSLPQNVARSA